MKNTKKDVNGSEKEVDAKEGTDMSIDDGAVWDKEKESSLEDQE